MGQLGFNNVRGGSIREPLSTQTEQRVANRGAPIRTPCRVTSGHQQPMVHHQRALLGVTNSRSAGGAA